MTAQQTSRRSRPSRTIAAVAVLATAILGPLLVSSPASAHDALVGTSPADGETVQTLPESITLTFSGSLLEGAPQAVFVTDASCEGISDATPGSISIDRDACTDYAQGDAVVEGPLLTQAIDVSGAPAGEYTVIASVTYGDSHSEDELFRFTTTDAVVPSGSPDPTTSAEPTTTPSAESAEAAPSPTASADGDGTESGFARALPWIVGSAVVAAGGGALIAFLVSRSRRSS